MRSHSSLHLFMATGVLGSYIVWVGCGLGVGSLSSCLVVGQLLVLFNYWRNNWWRFPLICLALPLDISLLVTSCSTAWISSVPVRSCVTVVSQFAVIKVPISHQTAKLASTFDNNDLQDTFLCIWIEHAILGIKFQIYTRRTFEMS